MPFKAWFGLPVSSELDLSNPLYMGTSSTASLVVTYSHISDDFSGFFSPVDAPPTINQVKSGSAIPVKFSLGAYYGLDIFAPHYPRSSVMVCNVKEYDVIEETVRAGHSELIYDPATGQYIYICKTERSWSGTCRILTLRFRDGREVYAFFQFTR